MFALQRSFVNTDPDLPKSFDQIISTKFWANFYADHVEGKSNQKLHNVTNPGAKLGRFIKK